MSFGVSFATLLQETPNRLTGVTQMLGSGDNLDNSIYKIMHVAFGLANLQNGKNMNFPKMMAEISSGTCANHFFIFRFALMRRDGFA